MKTRSARIRLRAEKLLREGAVPYWSKAVEQAAREIDRAAFGAHREPDGKALKEAAERLFGNAPPRPEISDEELAEAASRLFGGGGNPSNLSESFRRRSRGGRR